MKQIIQIHPSDNVVVALQPLEQNTTIEINGKQITVREFIPKGHKLSITEIPEAASILKYGYPIGQSVRNITIGEHVHNHNVRTKLDEIISYHYQPVFHSLNIVNRMLSFKGYKRTNGLVGIRNNLWIVVTVGCVNGVAEKIKHRFLEQFTNHNFDAVEVIKHNYGCSQLGDDHENTKSILKDIVLHPNAGGVLVLGLGCENNKIDVFRNELGTIDSKRIKFLSTQSVEDEIEEGFLLLKEIYSEAKSDVRTDIPLSELKVGLKCGGSDGFSGITANPLVGNFSDFLIAQGGTTVLTEVPEMFGAETILMERAESELVFNKTVELITDFKEYFISQNQVVYENPSPGNKDGGITTLEDKSLGCIQKGGKSTIVDVLNYGERLNQNGLNLLNGPGNDLVSTTALGASGCHLVLFTTGRGTPFGSFIPTIKISSNSQIAKLKPHWIDFNAGELIEEQEMEDLLEKLIDFVIEVASGKPVNHEKTGIHEIAIFKTGVTL